MGENDEAIQHVQNQLQDKFEKLRQRTDMSELRRIIGEKVTTLIDERFADRCCCSTKAIHPEDSTIAEPNLGDTTTLHLRVTDNGSITYG
ncbi:MAG: hypothetical protein U5L04_08700 [Trueperaceae bacterium]|nr:hypothetical protein [Trueperaceae bacterium]